MNLIELERKVIKAFLVNYIKYIEADKVDMDILDKYISNIKVVSRDYTGVGFFTELAYEGNSGLELDDYIGGNVGAKLNSSVNTGYVLYLESGVLNCIEGYVYGEDWPENIVDIELYDTEW